MKRALKSATLSLIILAVAFILGTVVVRFLFGLSEQIEIRTTWITLITAIWYLGVLPILWRSMLQSDAASPNIKSLINGWFLILAFFIAFLAISALGWSWVYRDQILHSTSIEADKQWIRMVFGSWIVVMMPFLYFMYSQYKAIFKAP